MRGIRSTSLISLPSKGIPVLYAPTPSIGAASPVTLGGSFVLNMAEYTHRSRPRAAGEKEVRRSSSAVDPPLWTCGRPFTPTRSRDDAQPLRSQGARGVSRVPCSTLEDSAIPRSPTSRPTLDAPHLLYAAIAGGNLIHDVGYLASGMTSSLEMLTICDEQIAQIKRYLKSFALDKESLAVDLIDEVRVQRATSRRRPDLEQVQG